MVDVYEGLHALQAPTKVAHDIFTGQPSGVAFAAVL